MPAKSKAQQSAMAMALAAKSGKMPMKKLMGPAKKMAKTMSKKKLREFASTPRKGLPPKAKKMQSWY